MFYVYVLSNDNNRVLYIGVTNDLRRRVYEHKSEKIEGFTKEYHVHKLVYFEKYFDPIRAISREKQLKKWTRKKKDDLIDKMNPQREDLASRI
ncbi:MAG: GIY-YIG nuclease family protein [Clostridia bacterium]|nr:GIY-YIG nuclease family protein [Clostridia bacterium]